MWNDELKLAIFLAKQAGELLQSALNNKVILSNENKDIKLQADKNSEHLIIEGLQKEFAYAILSEEKGLIGQIKSGEPYWIIDPLDGTFNYANDIPMCAVSIALWKDDKPILGVINLFKENELLYGIVSQGLYRNDTKLECNNELKTLSQSTLVTGFPLNYSVDVTNANRFFIFSGKFKKVRMLGSATTSLAYVALNRAQVYWEEEIMLWDVAAGIALVCAAGGSAKVSEGKMSKWARKVIAFNCCEGEEINEI